MCRQKSVNCLGSFSTISDVSEWLHEYPKWQPGAEVDDQDALSKLGNGT
jgi:hypothetical protein